MKLFARAGLRSCIVALAMLAAGALSAQGASSFSTPSPSSSFFHCGIMFAVTATNEVKLHRIGVPFFATGARDVEVWYRVGGMTTTLGAGQGWIKIGSANTNVVSASPTITQIPLDLNLTVPAGQTYGIIVTQATAGMFYGGTAAGPFSDSNISVDCNGWAVNGYNAAQSPPWTTWSGVPRGFWGTLWYDQTSTPAPEMNVVRGATSIGDGATDIVTGTTVAVQTNLTYTIQNLGTAALSLPGGFMQNMVNCSVGWIAPPPGAVSAGASANFTVRVTPATAASWEFVMTHGSNDSNENPYDWLVTGVASPPPAPEMELSRAAAAIANGSTDAVTATVAGTTANLTYDIANTGTAALTLSTVATPSAQANCAASVIAQPATSVAASASTTLILSLTPTFAGVFSCAVSIANNDANENPYAWTISGNAAPAPAPEMDVSRSAVAVASGGNDALGSVASGTPQTVSYSIVNSGTAGLNLTGAPGLVSVTAGANVSAAAVTVQPSASLAPAGNTSFSITYTVAAIGAFSFDISIANNDANENPYAWSATGNSAGTLPEMEVLRGTLVADGSSDVLGSATVANAFTLTYTMSNSGGMDLQVNTPVTVAGVVNCTVVVSQQPAATVAGGASTTMVMQVTPLAAGAFSFNVSIGNTDANENPYDWSAVGSATPGAGGNGAIGGGGGGGCTAGEGSLFALFMATLLSLGALAKARPRER